MSNLVKYDAARYALEQAVSVDEVKDIRDKAQAMAAYAKQAKDTKLVEWATEIKVRAERKAGQMLAELNLKPGPKTISSSVLPIDVSKTQSSRWQKLAAVPGDQFEQAVIAAKEVAGEVTTAAMLRIERAQNPKPVKPTEPAATESDDEAYDHKKNEQEYTQSPEEERKYLLDELTESEKENGHMKAVIKSLEVVDSAAEIIALHKRCQGLEGRLGQEITTKNEAVKTANYYGGLLKKIATAVGVEKYSDIIKALKS